MEDELMHELVAGYALDSLDDDERRAFEVHLATCEHCREELEALAAPTLALALGAPAAAPPAALRSRIIDAARAERGNVTPLRPRWVYPLAAAAAIAAFAAIGLGAWAWTLHSRLGSVQAMHGLPLTGARGSVVVGRGGEATLVVSGLVPLSPKKIYELWVIHAGTARAAGMFSPRIDATTIIRLNRSVPSGSRVGITVEPKGGSQQPTTRPVVVSAPA